MPNPAISGFEARLRMAQADKTSAEILTELASDFKPQIRQAVARNPNTPIDALLKLGEEFPNDVIENPIFQLLLLEDANSRFAQLSFARSSLTDENALLQLAETQDEAVQIAIACKTNEQIH